MGQVSAVPVTSVPAVVPVAPVQTPASEEVSNQRAVTQAVSTAVRKVNDSGYLGEGKEITFSFDRASHTPVIKVVDTETKEILHQWPSEYLLEIAAEPSRQTRDSG